MLKSWVKKALANWCFAILFWLWFCWKICHTYLVEERWQYQSLISREVGYNLCWTSNSKWISFKCWSNHLTPVGLLRYALPFTFSLSSISLILKGHSFFPCFAEFLFNFFWLKNTSYSKHIIMYLLNVVGYYWLWGCLSYVKIKEGGHVL